MGVLSRLDSSRYTIMIKAIVVILLVGATAGAPRGSENQKDVKEGEEQYMLKEGEADVAGWMASKSCIDSGKLLQCTKSAKSICPEDKLKVEVEDEEVDDVPEEKVKPCIDSGKLLRCIRS